ncbi:MULTISPECIES: FAD-dependent oxidoreductase [unclassified Leifsonia]|uniref:NAD(P)/FAD-dependent oxidoreductase n=1 Tax=unclassified Leifsonia TaxID=2663824 RepID=UPI0008A80C72|nr:MULTISPECIES: FAD-dependent oxidoreductase [unclassified Leifsonia]SEI01634.1 NADH dehydrogenase [Leifsonia sp. CL154]SFL70059.1 NADH dehydrogenase [Leifsonia sp. CL147]
MPEPNILILGAGFSGFTLARALRRDAAAHRLRLTVVEPEPYLTYKPLLPEVAGGETLARDSVVPLRRPLKHAEVVAGSLESVDTAAKVAVVRTLDGTQRPLQFDHVVFALGAVTRTLPIPGLAETAIGFSSVEEASYLRDHVLDRIRFAAATADRAERRRALTFVFVGGGYTGVEAIAELQRTAAAEFERYRELDGERMAWLLVEAAGRIAAELTPELSAWTLRLLRRRGIQVLLHTEMKSCEDGHVVLSTGETYPADTLVWVAGVTPNPVLARADVPLGPKGHVQCNASLQAVRDDGTPLDGVWALGDDAQVPDLTAQKQPAYYPPNAQNAIREGRVLAGNLRRALDGSPPAEYRHKTLGTLASYGGMRGAAVVRGIPLRGLAAWTVDKLYHAIALPSTARRFRLVLGWIGNGLTAPDTAPVGTVLDPRGRFREAAEAQSRE